MSASDVPASHDVLVVGGGPAGAAAATFLARGGLSVALVERERFPRFHIGESLLPANLPLLERMGVLDRIAGHGFLRKYGAAFHDQETGLEYTFYYDPAFLEIFLRPSEAFAMLDSVTGVLAGGGFVSMPLRMRLSLMLFFAIVRANRWRRRRGGRPSESRLEW